MSLLTKILIGVGAVIVVVGSVYIYHFRPVLAVAVDENNLPKFIQADFIDLSKIGTISKFRSAAGHDFSGHGETCRSMKHYFTPIAQADDPSVYGHEKLASGQQAPAPDPATATSIYSPVDGRIESIGGEVTPIGQQFSIRPDSQPGYTVRLFHIYPLDGIKQGVRVKAGQKIGLIGKGQSTDISVQVNTLQGEQFVSYFQVMPDNVFARYQAAGMARRSDVILTKAQRDAKPLSCGGATGPGIDAEHAQEFFSVNYEEDPNYDEDVYINGFSKAAAQAARMNMQQN